MIVEPRIKGFICTTAHPDGCRENVIRQIEFVKKNGIINGPKKVLIIGASTGYGLASRITAAFGCQADTIGIMYEREASGKRTASPGWYNTKAFEEEARKAGLYAYSINKDAFLRQTKEEAMDVIEKNLGKIDMIIYSLAAPRRTTEDGQVYESVLKPIGEKFSEKSWNLTTNVISEATIEPATQEEVDQTVKVMGGEDWQDWIRMLAERNLLSNGAVTIAYSYIGPELTYPVYYNGTIGMAKKHLQKTAQDLTTEFTSIGMKAYISVNKALVTQASSAIPIVPLYFALLYQVMKEKGIHEGCIEQTDRMFREKLFSGRVITDDENRIRLDDLEMRKDVQEETMRRWKMIHCNNLSELADLKGYWDDFYHMFGFGFSNVDYTKEVEI